MSSPSGAAERSHHTVIGNVDNLQSNPKLVLSSHCFALPDMCSRYTDSPAVHEYMLSAIFLFDMVVKFHLAFVEHEQLVTDPHRIRARYLRYVTTIADYVT